jgi:dolichyl-phosphate beta-glucosyltransferase
MDITLSIVVPLYNETHRLTPGIEAIRAYLDSRNFSSEVVFVDDGSTDGTADMVNRVIEGDDRFRLVAYTPNQGKGKAVKVGMLEAKGAVRLFTDIDLSVPIEVADEFLAKIQEGNPIVIGTRRVEASNVKVHQPRYRELLGEAYRRIVQAVFAPGISDFTCGFKAFNAEATETIFSQSRIKRWSFDTEILFLATRWGYRVCEIPVEWINSPATRVNLLLDVGRSAWELFLIRYNWLTNRYVKR